VATYFRDFDDLWTPFLGGQGPAPALSDVPAGAAACRRARRRPIVGATRA
jgi:hypothetical protein